MARDGGSVRFPAVARKQARDISDAADVGIAVLFGKPEAFRQVGAHLIAVEHLGAPASLGELLLQAGRRPRLPPPPQSPPPKPQTHPQLDLPCRPPSLTPSRPP